MMRRVHFTKMHGAGNDYIYVDSTLFEVPDPRKAAVEWSRPHFGIGSDGLVLIGKADAGSGADFTMRIFNNDGSEAMMCGNASRCIGKYLFEKGKTTKTEIRLGTLSGVKTLRLHLSGDGKTVESVTVDMLEPQFEASAQYLPDARDGGLMRRVMVEAGADEGVFVSMGNPHYVIFTGAAPDDENLRRWGQLLENDAKFPQRCNVEFAHVTGKGTIRTRVWERGSGVTMACGTGACATAVAAASSGRCGRSSSIVMDGGTLDIDWRTDNHVYLSGPAAFVFEGEIDLP